MLMASEQVCWIPISDIAGWQEEERSSSSPSEEAETMLENDGATVLLALREDGGYQILSGKARLRELRALGQNCVDAVISPKWNIEERISTLLSNLLKGEMHYLDEAEEYRSLLNTGLLTRQELATRIGRTQATVQKKLRLLTLGEATRAELRAHGLCERYAQALLRIPGEQGRARMAAHIGERGLSVKEAEELVDSMLQRMPIPVPKDRKLMPAMRDHRLYMNAIRGIVEQMCDAGLKADMQISTGTTVVEVRITFPRFSQPRK